MSNYRPIIAKTIKAALFTLAFFALPAVVFAQEATQTAGVPILYRILQVLAGLGVVATLIGLGYGLTALRNATQNNDILLGERGRKIMVISVVFFFISLIILVVSFVLIARQSSVSDLAKRSLIQPSGADQVVSKDALILNEAIPIGSVPVQNILVQLLFSQPVQLSEVESSIRIVKVEDQSEVVGEWSVDSTYVTFQPNQVCEPPNSDQACFDPLTAYEVHIARSLKSDDGDLFKCSLVVSAEDCIFTFTTGEIIDTTPPNAQMTLPYDQTSVSADSGVLLEALGKDDTAMAMIHFFVNDVRVGTASVSSGDIFRDFRGAANWNTSGEAVKTKHAIRAEAVDMAGQSKKSDAISIEILPLYCFDEAQNDDEEGVDCGGPTCGGCIDSVCVRDSECASGLCFEGICRNFPVVQEVLYPDGAPGNYITIRGQNFGDETGVVTFLGAVGDEDDTLATKPACDITWKNNEAIVTVPEGAFSGPLKLETSDGLFDVTDDAKGGRFSFNVSAEVRPGLCEVQEQQQFIGETVQLIGQGLGEEAGDIKFGRILAEEIGAWGVGGISDIIVPQIEPGMVSIQVITEDGESNPILFTAEPSPTLPRLASISPSRGPVSQMVTIQGQHLDKSLVLKFINTTTGEEVVANRTLPDICVLHQSTDQRAAYIPGLEIGTYQVIAETEAGKSNKLTFRVTAGERLPGICAMVPDNGPLGIDVTFHGEELGPVEGGVRFSPRIDDTSVISWSGKEVNAVVPANVQSGQVQVFNAEGILSNPFEFTVGSCSPDTCEVGFQCCGNGACQKAGTCTDSVPFCTYAWFFSTGDNLEGPPRVIEDATCRTNTQSPSPFKDTKDGCLNASIVARFTHDMQNQTIIRDNITVQRCNSGASFDENSCDTTVNLRKTNIINQDQPGEGFIAIPQSRLIQDTWYQVTLSTGFTATNGISISSPYIWSFRTQEGTGECPVDHVEVTPPSATVDRIGTQQRFYGLPTALNCNLLDPDAYQWSWLSSNTGKAVLLPTTGPQSDVKALAPTEPGPPVKIIGEIPLQSVEDSGALTILLRPPTVIDQWPNCSVACPNAMIGATFDQPMQEGSVTSETNVNLFECADASCARTGLSNAGIRSLRYNNVANSIFFLPNSGILNAGKTYRVILSNIRGESGIALGNLNYDQNEDGIVDSYSWLFKVKDEGDLCTIDRVSIIPEFAISNLIGQEFDYFSFPVSKPDECSAEGQLLNPESFEWTWKSLGKEIADVSSIDDIPPEGFVDPYQITTSVGEGETGITASAQDTTGEGNITVVCGYENDNDCPAPATVDTYGVGKNSCCYERPQAVTFNPKEGDENVCTTLAVEVIFDQIMDRTSLIENTFLEVDNGAQPCVEDEPAEETNGEPTVWNHIRSWANKAAQWVIPSLNAQSENWCELKISVTLSDKGDVSSMQVFPADELLANTRHRLRINGDKDLSDDVTEGATNKAGVAIFQEESSLFTTGESECVLDLTEIIVTPPGEAGVSDAFFCAGRNDCEGDANEQAEGNQHKYQVIGRDLYGYVVPTEFSWRLTGQDLIKLNVEEGDEVEGTTGTDNGNTSLTVFAEALAPSKGNLSRTVDITVFICENPWPNISDFPYSDNDFGYDTYYCRDFGEPGTHDDLPPLGSPIQGADIGQFLQDSLFIVE